MTKYLIIGVNGTIGSALFAKLQSINESVSGTSQRKACLNQSVHYLNLLDPSSSWRLPDAEIVFICAGVARMQHCEEAPELAYQVNVERTIELVRHYAAQGSFIVYLSTNQVFSGNKSYVNILEPYSPCNEYGRQKRAAEEKIKAIAKDFAIVRLTKVMEKGAPLFQNWINNLQNNQKIEAFTNMYLAPVDLETVIESLIMISDKKISNIYHLSGDHDLSYYDAACELAESCGKSKAWVSKGKAETLGMTNFHLPRFTTLDCSSTIALSNFKPPSFSTVIKKCFEFK